MGHPKADHRDFYNREKNSFILNTCIWFLRDYELAVLNYVYLLVILPKIPLFVNLFFVKDFIFSLAIRLID